MAPATVSIASGATWQEVAADRQAYRDQTISLIEPSLPEITDIPLNTLPLAKQVLTPEEIQITESTVEDLAATIAKGGLSAVTVTKAFLRRAALAQKAVYSPYSTPFLFLQDNGRQGTTNLTSATA
jgi:amidase